MMYLKDALDLSESSENQTGSYLDEMTNDLPHDMHVEFFYSAGPNLYCIYGHKRPAVKKSFFSW